MATINPRFTESELQSEVWRPVHIERYTELYEVSTLGRVRRCAPGKNTYAGRLLTPTRPNPRSHKDEQYAHVGLFRNGVGKTVRIHILVARAFLGPPPPDKSEVNHIDTDKLNNRATNLEYQSPKGNSAHAAVHSLFPSGPRHYRSIILTFKDQTKTLTEWAKLLNMKPDTLQRRLKRMSVDDALTRPLR